MSFVRYKKRGNKWYAYEVTSFWDKKTKTPRQKSIYLGVSDSDGGAYNKPGKLVATRIEKEIVDFGDSFALQQIANNSGFSEVLNSSFTESDSIMSLLCYQMLEGSAMHLCEDWLEGNVAKHLFPKAKTSSQSISRLIKSLGEETTQRKFFRHYIQKFFPDQHGVLIDSTSLPSSINTSINAFGYGSDGIKQNIGCLMLVDEASKLPIYFRAIPGDIADVSTIRLTLDEIMRLGLKTNSAILDAGYFCENNVRYLCEQGINFVTRMPKSRKIYKQLVDESGNIERHAHAVIYGNRGVFIKSMPINLYDNSMFAHVVLDPGKRAADIQNILRQSNAESYTSEELDEKMRYAGYFILISSKAVESNDILPTYYTRQNIEQIFGFAKSSNNILPLRVHSEESVRGYMMLVFLSVILFILMRQKLAGAFTVEQALIILRALKAKIYDSKIVPLELNKKAKNICSALNIIVPTSLGV